MDFSLLCSFDIGAFKDIHILTLKKKLSVKKKWDLKHQQVVKIMLEGRYGHEVYIHPKDLRFETWPEKGQ